MENIRPREIDIERTGKRSYQIKTMLFEEETIDQETIDKTLHGLVDYTMNHLKEQKCISSDSEVSTMDACQSSDNNVVISVKWHTASNDMYIVCNTLDAVITVVRQIN